jgi:2-polyprenyl-6-hydroxyphenyl methylase/3-demethylubiquinone-9 3-methyltransferase
VPITRPPLAAHGSVACVACETPATRAFVATPQFVLRECPSCASLTADPRPRPEPLLAYHDTPGYFDQPYFEKRRTDVDRVVERCRDLDRRLRTASPRIDLRGARHLDVGCDTGVFLRAFADLYGTIPIGVDVSARAVAAARASGIEAHCAELEAAPGFGECGLVTLIDVIEHVPSPLSLLRAVRHRLGPGGWCYVETPNVRSSIYRIGRALTRWTGGRPASVCARLFIPEHVQYLSRDGLGRLARNAGLTMVAAGERRLAPQDVNASLIMRGGVRTLQALDRLIDQQILHCVLLRREDSRAPAS